MFISQIQLHDFRNYESLDLSLEPGSTVFLGKNGQGKTNLVEAIRYLSVLRSHRVTGYQNLIRTGTDTARILVEANHAGRKLRLELEINRDKPNRAMLNRSPLPKTREIIGLVTSVTFAPEDIDIVRLDPVNRREFLDELVIQFNPRLSHSYQEFERVLKQRNSLLKSVKSLGPKAMGSKAMGGEHSTTASTLEIWDEALVKFGSEITLARKNLIERLRPHLRSAYAEISGSNKLADMQLAATIFGAPSGSTEDSGESESTGEDDIVSRETSQISEMTLVDIETKMREAIASVRTKELDRGLTLIGPHRDELALTLGGHPVKGFASHGETWSFALALRLATFRLLKSESDLGDPILILDDVFAELDSDRRRLLVALVGSNEQTLITAAVAEDVPTELAGRVIGIRSGRLMDSAAESESDANTTVERASNTPPGSVSREGVNGDE